MHYLKCLPCVSAQLHQHPSTWPFLLEVSSMTASHWLGVPLSTPMVLSGSMSSSCHLLSQTSLSTQLAWWWCYLTWPLVPSTLSQWGPSLWPLDRSVILLLLTLLMVRTCSTICDRRKCYPEWVELKQSITLLWYPLPSLSHYFSALNASRCPCSQQYIYHHHCVLDRACCIFSWALKQCMHNCLIILPCARTTSEGDWSPS